MRIHTNALTLGDLWAAARSAGVYLERSTEHGSRTRDHAFDVILSGSSPYRINSGEFGQEQAASWDEWGIFLETLFDHDPIAHCWAYKGQDDFHRATGWHYVNFTREDLTHTQHRWAWSGGSVGVCRLGCGAVRSWARPRLYVTPDGFSDKPPANNVREVERHLNEGKRSYAWHVA